MNIRRIALVGASVLLGAGIAAPITAAAAQQSNGSGHDSVLICFAGQQLFSADGVLTGPDSHNVWTLHRPIFFTGAGTDGHGLALSLSGC